MIREWIALMVLILLFSVISSGCGLRIGDLGSVRGVSPTSNADDKDVYGALPTLSAVSPPCVSTVGGDRLTLTGEGLSAGNTVTVGGIACAEVSVTGTTRITCTVPALPAGSANVTVTGATDELSATIEDGVTYGDGCATP